MTPERQKWWDSLPTKQKYLYREIAHLKYKRSAEKYHANTTWSSTVKRIALDTYQQAVNAVNELAEKINKEKE